MNKYEEQSNRQIIPRWLSWRAVCQQVPPDASSQSPLAGLVDDVHFARTRARWENERTQVNAADLALSALLSGRLGDTEVGDAIEYLRSLDPDPESTIGLLAAGLTVAGFSPPPSAILDQSTDPRALIARARRVLDSHERDPLLYLDLAYAHSLLMQNVQAERNLKIALSLAPEHPLILRSAARFLLHIAEDNDPDQSLRILRRSGAVRHDPGVLAAEIAISEAFSRRSKNRKLGRSLAFSKNFHPFFLSELAGTIGTLEARHGSRRYARQALEASAVCPTENSLAQLEWISPRVGIEFEVPGDCATEPFEARTRFLFRNQEYAQALSAAVAWAEYQPLSSRPALTASHLASVWLDKYETAIRVLRTALMYSPDSFALRNNLAFALASSGQVDEATAELDKTERLDLDPSDEAVRLATRGLLAFRTHNHEEGRRLYEEAENGFRSLRDRDRNALAKAFHAREELLEGTPESSRIGLDALEVARATGIGRIKAIEFVEKAIGEGGTPQAEE